MLNLFKTFMRRFCLYLGIVMVICGILPIVTHRIWRSEGIWALLLGEAFLLLLRQETLFQRLFERHWHRISYAAYGLVVASVLFALALTAMIVRYAFFHYPPKDTETTLVVLGCKISDDRPTVMLRQRLDSALRLMEKDLSLNCVVSGDRGRTSSSPKAKLCGNT